MRSSLWWTLLGLVVAAGCAEEPEATWVEGSVGAVRFAHPVALYSTGEAQALTGIRDPTVLITDAPEACRRLVRRNDGAAIRGEDGLEVPSLLLTMGGHSYLVNDRRPLGSDLQAKVHPGGQRLEPQCDGVWICPEPARTALVAESGEAFIRRVDDPGEPGSTAKGRFDLTFPDGERLQGEFVARPCAAVEFSGGCGQAPGAVGASALVVLAGLLGARRRRGAGCLQADRADMPRA